MCLCCVCVVCVCVCCVWCVWCVSVLCVCGVCGVWCVCGVCVNILASNWNGLQQLWHVANVIYDECFTLLLLPYMIYAIHRNTVLSKPSNVCGVLHVNVDNFVWIVYFAVVNKYWPESARISKSPVLKLNCNPNENVLFCFSCGHFPSSLCNGTHGLCRCYIGLLNPV